MWVGVGGGGWGGMCVCVGVWVCPNSDQIIIFTCGHKKHSCCQRLQLQYDSLIKLMKIHDDVIK